jgi:[CysO sulfur-carrier protein]-S-L-cysteine hydrolase
MKKHLLEKAEAAGIPGVFVEKILDQAESEYPRECCGVITGGIQETYRRVRACRNVQDDYHARDPENFPRTSRNAYWMDPHDLLELQKELRAQKEEIRIIYHSHIDAEAYFSPEDVRMALLDGRPAYPGVKYLVISVKSGKGSDLNLYGWDDKRKEFLARL